MHYLDAISKNNRMISVCFQGKLFNITVIQVYAPTSNVEEAEVEWFYEDLQNLIEHQKKMPFSSQGTRCKSRKPREIPGVVGSLIVVYKIKQGKG